MREIFAASLIIAAALCGPADAAEPMTQGAAREVGYIVGSADVCGYTLSEKSLTEAVAARLAVSALDIRNTYEFAVSGRPYRLKNVGPSERLVACETQKRLASKYGIILD